MIITLGVFFIGIRIFCSLRPRLESLLLYAAMLLHAALRRDSDSNILAPRFEFMQLCAAIQVFPTLCPAFTLGQHPCGLQRPHFNFQTTYFKLQTSSCSALVRSTDYIIHHLLRPLPDQ